MDPDCYKNNSAITLYASKKQTEKIEKDLEPISIEYLG